MRQALRTRAFLLLLALSLSIGATLSFPAPAQAYGECFFVDDYWCYFDTGGWCRFNCRETCNGDTSGQIYFCEYMGQDCCGG